MAAKCMATVDQAIHGLAGLNVVAGWNQEEFDMSGLSQEEHDGRYEQAREWCQMFRRLTAGGKPFYHERASIATGHGGRARRITVEKSLASLRLVNDVRASARARQNEGADLCSAGSINLFQN